MAILSRWAAGARRRRFRVGFLGSVRGRIIAGFGLLVLIIISGAAGSTWLARCYQSDVAHMDHDSRALSLIQEAAADGAFAFALLQVYVTTGDPQDLAVIRENMASATAHLAEAQADHLSHDHHGIVAKLDEFVAQSGFASQVVENAIALRQSGDVQAASRSVAAAAPQLMRIKAGFDAVTELDRSGLAALRAQADRSGTLAFWLLAVAGAGGAVLGLAVSLAIARSILRPLGALESAAGAVAGGNLRTRAPAGGPRELARLGAAFNRMTDSLLDASKCLELEEQREKALAQLRESEAHVAAITRSATDAIITVDGRGRVSHWNPAAEAMFGYSSEEAAGREVHRLIVPPAARRDFVRGLRAFKATGQGPLVGRTLELTALRRDGTEFPVEISLSAVRLSGGWHAVGIVRDITQRKRIEAALWEQVRRDSLTGALNHAAIVGELSDVLAGGRDDARHAVAMVDVDGLKAVNDTYGHAMGDAILVTVAQALTRDNATVGRYGGDEFVVVLRGADRAAAERYKMAVLDVLAGARLSEPSTGARVPVVASVGLAAYPEDAATVADLISVSDSAMYAAKRQRPVGTDCPAGPRPLGSDRAAEMVGQIVPLLTSCGGLEEKLRLVAQRISVGAGYDGVRIFVNLPGGPSEPTVSVFPPLAGELLTKWSGLLSQVRDDRLYPALRRVRRPIIVNDPQQDPEIRDRERAMARAAGVGSFLVAPMFWQEELIGSISAASRRKAAFTSRDARFLMAVADQVTAIVRLATLVDSLKAASGQLRQAHAETVMLLAAAAEAHDGGTAVHLQNVRALTEALARELAYSEDQAREAGLAAVLHDIGKIRVPQHILHRRSKLTPSEWATMKRHALWGAEFLTGRPGFELAATVARSHHERWDGGGYPDGLAGEAIPEVATIVTVADSFDAMTTDRPYRARLPVEAAIREIVACSGRQFSPRVATALVRLYRRNELPLERAGDEHLRAA